jgi:hypothetical protein
MRGWWGISISRTRGSYKRRDSHVSERRDFFHPFYNILFQLTRMFKPSTKHNIQAGPSSGYAEVKLNGKAGSGNGNGQVSGRYPYRLNL